MPSLSPTELPSAPLYTYTVRWGGTSTRPSEQVQATHYIIEHGFLTFFDHSGVKESMSSQYIYSVTRKYQS